ncbi:MAG: hypothetical protein WBO95_04825 [Candidatus Dechloromonas phosphoritropha]|jgi:hypothetical protein
MNAVKIESAISGPTFLPFDPAKFPFAFMAPVGQIKGLVIQ